MEPATIDKKIKAADRDLRKLVIARGSTLLDSHGIEPSGAARLLADVGVQLRNPTAGRVYFDEKKAAGKTSMEAMRSLERRLSNVVYVRRPDPGHQPFGQATTRTCH